jgi:hypothetical protein
VPAYAVSFLLGAEYRAHGAPRLPGPGIQAVIEPLIFESRSFKNQHDHLFDEEINGILAGAGTGSANRQCPPGSSQIPDVAHVPRSGEDIGWSKQHRCDNVHHGWKRNTVNGDDRLDRLRRMCAENPNPSFRTYGPKTRAAFDSLIRRRNGLPE